jgi:uncharacterized integral membrane protein
VRPGAAAGGAGGGGSSGVRTFVWLLLLFIVVTIFALSNTMIVSVNFLRWELFRGHLALVIIGAGVIGALLTYAGSVRHHVRQARQIRRLQGDVRPPAAPLPVAGPPPHVAGPPPQVVAAPEPRPSGETPGAS